MVHSVDILVVLCLTECFLCITAEHQRFCAQLLPVCSPEGLAPLHEVGAGTCRLLQVCMIESRTVCACTSCGAVGQLRWSTVWWPRPTFGSISCNRVKVHSNEQPPLC